MIIRINGIKLQRNVIRPVDVIEFIEETGMKKTKKRDLKKLYTFAWSMSGLLFAKASALAAPVTANAATKVDLWTSLLPVFGLFQQMAMVLGAFAIIGALIMMIFKKRVGIQTLGTIAIAISGVFLVPAAMMLLAIIGNLINDTLIDAFRTINVNGGGVKLP